MLWSGPSSYLVYGFTKLACCLKIFLDGDLVLLEVSVWVDWVGWFPCDIRLQAFAFFFSCALHFSSLARIRFLLDFLLRLAASNSLAMTCAPVFSGRTRLVLACKVALSFSDVLAQSIDRIADTSLDPMKNWTSAVGSPFPQRLHGHVQEGSNLLLSKEGRFDP